MPEHDLEKLLGGFAADTLTPDERERLFSAALHDQQLFNVMADEQALKELLADPAVRRRLLQALADHSTPSDSRSWFSWLRRPAGLVAAGGLAAALFALALGTKVYQDSLRQAARSATTEDPTPAAAPVPPPQPASPQRAEPSTQERQNSALDQSSKKDQRPDMATQERSPRSEPKEGRASEAAPKAADQPAVKAEIHPQAEPPVVKSHRTEDGRTSTFASPPGPAVGASEPEPASTPASQSGDMVSPAGARALFYRLDQAIDQQSSSAVSPLEEGRPDKRSMAGAPRQERTGTERSTAMLGKLESKSAVTPLGIRYSLIMTGPGGIDMEVDPATPVGKEDAPRLAIQANANGYLSVFYLQPSNVGPAVLFPLSGDGQVTSFKTIAVPLAAVFEKGMKTEEIRLRIVLSRAAPAISAPSETDRSRPLIEHVDPGQPGALTEQAVYVVNPPSVDAASVAVDLTLFLHP